MLRHYVLTAPLLAATACTGLIDSGPEVFSPDDPAAFSERMFDESALSGYGPEERAYVQGHALAVYLYGKTLPKYVGPKGYSYEPGVSAEVAEVAYAWDDVMTASSGGIYGYGDDVDGPGDADDGPVTCDGENDDVCVGPGDGDGDGYDGDGDGFDDDGDGRVDEDYDGDGDGNDDDHDGEVDEDCDEFCDSWDGDGDGHDDDGDGQVDEDQDDDGDGYDDDNDGQVDEDYDGDGDGDGDGYNDDDGDGEVDEDGGEGDGGDGDGDGDGGDDVDDPWIDPDCEEFLDPAALEARELRTGIDAAAVLGSLTPADRYTIAAFHRGLQHALNLQDLNEDTEFSEVDHLKTSVQSYGLCEHSPLVLDLSGDGLAVSSVKDGVSFDLLSRGTSVRTAWPQDDDALLVLDRDGDGRITHGGELFGNSGAATHGFAALAELDSPLAGGNSDGVVDSRDAMFGELRLWTDSDRDGVSQDGELQSLADADVVSIDLDYATGAERDAAGNTHRQRATFLRKDGESYTSRSIVDVWFRFTSVR